jgi:UDP-N-acetylglucosamine 4,6-dehydratase/UDP-glucose 4-epimerase
MAEDQTYQCTMSNVIGTMNLLSQFKGRTFIAISTDKAAQVAGVYGATKLLMERLILEYSKMYPDRKYRVVRYGNVIYSTGSVLCKWRDALKKGEPITITDPSATRFFWTREQAVDLIFECLEKAKDARPWVPEMKAIRMDDLMACMLNKYAPDKWSCEINYIGLQPGENLHERIMEDGPASNEVERFTHDEIMKMI